MRGTIEITLDVVSDGSLSENYSEFSQILKTRVSLMKQGLTRSQAEGRILSMEWEHHTSSQLQVALQQRPAWVGKGRDGKALSEEEFQSLSNDFALHQNYLISPPPRIQRKLQKTWTLAAHRAWSLNFFYASKMDAEECVTAFFAWPAFATLRALSLKALPRQAIEDDIRGCWAKFCKGHPIKDSAVAAVSIAIGDLKRPSFKASEVPEIPEIKSLR